MNKIYRFLHFVEQHPKTWELYKTYLINKDIAKALKPYIKKQAGIPEKQWLFHPKSLTLIIRSRKTLSLALEVTPVIWTFYNIVIPIIGHDPITNETIWLRGSKKKEWAYQLYAWITTALSYVLATSPFYLDPEIWIPLAWASSFAKGLSFVLLGLKHREAIKSTLESEN